MKKSLTKFCVYWINHLLLLKNLSIMKKLALVVSVLLFVALAFSSCKSVQDCPAYGQTDVETEEVRA
jgi:hypothetical protein